MDDLSMVTAERDAMRDRAIVAEQERDAALADRERVVSEREEALAWLGALQRLRGIVAAERDRLRRELESLRDSLAHGPAPHRAPKGWVVDRLDAILRGES